jgi:hypothetical protein
LELLQKYSPRGLEYQEIDLYLNVGKSLYTVLDRLEDRQLITKRRSRSVPEAISRTDARRWVYCLPGHTTSENHATQKVDSTSLDTPPPTFLSRNVELVGESITGKEIEVSQQLFNTASTVIQQAENVDLAGNDSNAYKIEDTEIQQVIQHSTKDEGERGYVEQGQFDDVLQTEQTANSSTTSEDISSETNSFDHTSQQEAFNRKYQPVEVLNSEREWISGYWVHKCLEVANLEGIERKYALYAQKGEKYVFLGEIRLPRC